MKQRLTQLVHDRIKAHLRPGDFAVDATVGNGHDSLLLAEQVGATGRVCAIDVQAAAIAATRERLRVAGGLEQVQLHQDNHATVLATLAEQSPATARVIVFNLGYLPGSDKTIQTQAGDTVTALDASGRLLAPDGLLLVTAYRAHPGGANEAEAVTSWMRAKESEGWRVECHDPAPGKKVLPPVLWIIAPPRLRP